MEDNFIVQKIHKLKKIERIKNSDINISAIHKQKKEILTYSVKKLDPCNLEDVFIDTNKEVPILDEEDLIYEKILSEYGNFRLAALSSIFFFISSRRTKNNIILIIIQKRIPYSLYFIKTFFENIKIYIYSDIYDYDDKYDIFDSYENYNEKKDFRENNEEIFLVGISSHPEILINIEKNFIYDHAMFSLNIHSEDNIKFFKEGYILKPAFLKEKIPLFIILNTDYKDNYNIIIYPKDKIKNIIYRHLISNNYYIYPRYDKTIYFFDNYINNYNNAFLYMTSEIYLHKLDIDDDIELKIKTIFEYFYNSN